jgi:ribose 5-phosphate isomerase B
VLSLPARFIAPEQASNIVKAFFAAHFDGGRHQRRVDKIAEIEKEEAAAAK